MQWCLFILSFGIDICSVLDQNLSDIVYLWNNWGERISLLILVSTSKSLCTIEWTTSTNSKMQWCPIVYVSNIDIRTVPYQNFNDLFVSWSRGEKEYRKKMMIIRFTEFQCHRQLPKFESLSPFRAALWTGVTFSMSPASTFAPFRIKGSTTFLEPEIIDFILIN